tara:strand:+ start:2223 stop:2534 length:312 start_codon:yes stop_codon:yes gene_type:complete
MSENHIISKIETFLFNYLIQEDSILEYNANIYDNKEFMYIFKDIHKSDSHNYYKKNIFLNDIMEILTDVHSHIKIKRPTIQVPLKEYTTDIEILDDKIKQMDI